MEKLILTTTAQKWDAYFANIPPGQTIAPAWAVQHHADQLPLLGTALDLACGLGGNARFMALCGLKVHAWDISDNALTHLDNWARAHQMDITPTLVDLEQMLFPYQQYDLITLTYYINPNLWPQISQALKPGGKLIIQGALADDTTETSETPENAIPANQFNQAWLNQMQLSCEIMGQGCFTTPEGKSQKTAWFIGKKTAPKG